MCADSTKAISQYQKKPNYFLVCFIIIYFVSTVESTFLARMLCGCSAIGTGCTFVTVQLKSVLELHYIFLFHPQCYFHIFNNQ